MRQLLDQKLSQQLTQQKKEIRHEINILMESYFDPKFNALADGMKLLKERCVSREELKGKLRPDRRAGSCGKSPQPRD